MAKVESLNPGGSIKDRVAVALIEAAERDGKLKPGGTIVEPTSGNTGTGLAIAARLKGYRVIAVMPDKMSKEKIDLLRAYGAEVVVAPTAVPPESPESYYRVADRLAEEIPGAFQPNQYRNPANPQAHYLSTGPELWEQTGGRITHLVVGVGTGGTITGTGRYLKERNPDLQVIGADPYGSIYSLARGQALPRRGRRRGLLAADLRPVDRRPLRHGLRPRRLPHHAPPGDGRGHPRRRLGRPRRPRRARGRARASTTPSAMVAVILPDGGRSYLSKVYNDAWMTQHGFLERATDQTVGDVLLRQAARPGEIPPLVTVETHQKVRDAVALLHEHRVSQLPVVSAHDPRRSSARSASAACSSTPWTTPRVLNADIVDVMEPPFPAVSSGDPVREAVELLVGDRQALMVTEHGRATGILTRADLLEALAR